MLTWKVQNQMYRNYHPCQEYNPIFRNIYIHDFIQLKILPIFKRFSGYFIETTTASRRKKPVCKFSGGEIPLRVSLLSLGNNHKFWNLLILTNACIAYKKNLAGYLWSNESKMNICLLHCLIHYSTNIWFTSRLMWIQLTTQTNSFLNCSLYPPAKLTVCSTLRPRHHIFYILLYQATNCPCRQL